MEGISIVNISKTLNVSRPAIYRVKYNMEYERRGPKPKYNKKRLDFQMIRAVKADQGFSTPFLFLLIFISY